MMVAVGKSLSESGEDVRGAVAEALGALVNNVVSTGVEFL
jgi:hypothetical protein